ncbi:MAG TPA: lysophospholipid acyltransferase family protein [Gemmatimonadales bacterium]|nr:lysophospholipid acyltransferase family protein [Gemmatimonadales bacterium]
MIRLLWVTLIVLPSTAVHALAVIVAALLGVKRRPGGVYDWGTVDWSRQVLRVAGTPVEATGLERVPEGPVVYASNHTSMFDIWALAATLPGSTRFVAKQELRRVPLVGRAMVGAGHIFIDRTNRARAFDAYRQAGATIRGGISAIVFPEGTRSRTGDLLPFKNAPFALAIAAQVPIVPVYVADTHRILPKGSFRLRPMPIRLTVGEPIPTAGLEPDDREALRDRVREAIEQLKARVDVTARSR